MTDIDNIERELAGWQQNPRDRAVTVPFSAKLTSLAGFGPIPPTKITATTAIVQEGNRLDELPRTGELTLIENVVRTPAVRKAEMELEKAATGDLETQISGIRKLIAQITNLDDQVQRLTRRPLVGPDGEHRTPHEAEVRHEEIRKEVDEANASGSTRNRIDRTTSKARDIGLLLLDYPVFLLAMMGLLNVSYRLAFTGDPATLIKFATAAVFALLGTLVFAYTMRANGRRHRNFKSHGATLDHTGTARHRIVAEQIALATITIFVALVMGLRIYVEGSDADAAPALVIALSVLFASLVGMSGYLNYMSEYENGSDLTDRLQHFAAQLVSRSSALELLGRQRDLLIEESGIKITALLRSIGNAHEHAVRQVTTSTADKAIAVARSYHGSRVAVPAPTFLSESFERIKTQAAELDTDHKFLKAAPASGSVN